MSCAAFWQFKVGAWRTHIELDLLFLVDSALPERSWTDPQWTAVDVSQLFNQSSDGFFDSIDAS